MLLTANQSGPSGKMDSGSGPEVLACTMMEINILVQKDMLAALKHCNGQGNSQSGTSATGQQMCHTCGPTQHLKKHCPQNKDTAHIQQPMVPKIIWKTTLPKPNEAETKSGDRKLGIGVLTVVGFWWLSYSTAKHQDQAQLHPKDPSHCQLLSPQRYLQLQQAKTQEHFVIRASKFQYVSLNKKTATVRYSKDNNLPIVAMWNVKPTKIQVMQACVMNPI